MGKALLRLLLAAGLAADPALARAAGPAAAAKTAAPSPFPSLALQSPEGRQAFYQELNAQLVGIEGALAAVPTIEGAAPAPAAQAAALGAYLSANLAPEAATPERLAAHQLLV